MDRFIIIGQKVSTTNDKEEVKKITVEMINSGFYDEIKLFDKESPISDPFQPIVTLWKKGDSR